MKWIGRTVWCMFLLGVLVTLGCSSSDSGRNRCAEPTVSECLDVAITQDCRGQRDDFDDLCRKTFQAENLSPENPSLRVTSALVPELDGAHFRDREIKNVVHDDQPPLYVPEDPDPSSYSFRGSRNKLLNINDKLLVTDTYDHSDVFNNLYDSFDISPNLAAVMPRSTSKALTLEPIFQPINAQYMFDGLTYDTSNIYDLLDALFVGKVSEWNDNGLGIESCEEYVYERYYGYTLYNDFAALHFDDPYRVAEYAFQGAYLDEKGIHVHDSENIKAGAIGSRNLRYSMGAKEVILKKGTAVTPDPFMVYGEPTGDDDYMNSASYSLIFYYTNWLTSPTHTFMGSAGNVMDQSVLRYDDEATDCASASEPCGPDAEDLLPKNFFLETLGKINPENTSEFNGIVLSDPDLIAVYGQPDFDDAARALGNKGYINNWSYHLVMLEAAKRVMPNDTLRKKTLLEFKLLRKHLIDLLAERAYWENRISSTTFHFRNTYNILRDSETLSLSEKEYALQKLNEFNSGHFTQAGSGNLGISYPAVIISPSGRCNELDAQIEQVLLSAGAKGCLETDTDPLLHNYPTVNNDTIYHYGSDHSIAEMPDWLEDHAYDLDYDKVFCDWSPDKLVDAAQYLVPSEVLDKAYGKCRRVTGGNFQGTAPDNFTFAFPTLCDDFSPIDLWQPNTPADYTQDTNQFDKFLKLVEFYPKTLSDCDSFIEGVVKRELESRGMNYYDPVSGKVMMSKSTSFYNSFGGNYAGLRFGYALGWLYEGYDAISDITERDIADRSFVCSNTHYFAFGNYFVDGSFLTHDFVLCSAGSYASNKTTGTSKPVPPTLASGELQEKIMIDMDEVALDQGVAVTSFMFIKNEKMTYTYDESTGLSGEEVEVSHAALYNDSTHRIDYTNEAVSDTQMLNVSMKRSVPVCGIISVTVKGSVAGDIDADTYLTGDNAQTFSESQCKEMNFNYTPRIDFDAFASAAVTAGISGVASVSAGIDIGLKFVGLRFPYETDLFISERPLMVDGGDPDREFNYDIHTNVYSSLDYSINVLSGYFGAFVEIEYVVDSTTYRQTLFSWEGYNLSGNIERTGELDDGEKLHVKLPVRALYGLAHKLYQ